ncbi:Panacea domain-containing protein [Flavobacterium chungbukense]|uniref:Antitoxin SocA-like Panacea domain-containing protein n=1 Tax=Flavobacterium chungbukense TaxID=877464 RepID=A0ABP7XVT1_9FLAO|nr:Panacea domain-containing protein [Flavobacterium chungbukense]MCC4921711.1 SocA family protein [Flavobacterium chungbukense]
MGMYRSINNEKIGNILNYLSSNIEYLSMTKALKLLYIIDETSIKETGSPITWLDYKVWEMGPVAVDIYNEIKRNEIICYQGNELTVGEYIDLNIIDNEGRQEIYLKPKTNFNDKIFNQYELNLLEITVFKFGNWNAQDLIKYLHEENSLWHKTVKQHNLEEFFAKGQRKTNYSIEFTELIQDDPILSLANKAAQEALEFQQRLADYGEK